MVKSNLRYLLSILAVAGLHSKELKEVPPLKVEFNPLWSMSDQEKVALDLQKAQVAQTNANTASVYVQMQALDPQEVRNKLADDGEFDIETMLDDYSEEELEENNPLNKQQDDPMAAMMGMMGGEAGGAPGGAPGGMPGGAPGGGQEGGEAPEGGGMPPMGKPPVKAPEPSEKEVKEDEDETPHKQGVGVIVVRDGKVLTGTRLKGKGVGLIGGPGGHIEEGESPEEAARRETYEEFGIIPKDLVRIGHRLETGEGVKLSRDDAENVRSTIYLCTDFKGEPECDGVEMALPTWRNMEDLSIMDDRLFKPFRDGLDILKKKVVSGINENRNSWDGKE